MITSLHQTIKIENINFVGISSLILWDNTFKIREFRPKFGPPLKIFHDVYTKKKSLLPLLIMQLKSKILILLGFLHLFCWLTTFKIREFRPKFENFDHHSRFFT